MKTFASEFAHSYRTYSFGYCQYAILEDGDTYTDIYGKGYLPYSNSPGVFDTFYMARSARVPLASWKPSSENRRIFSKFYEQFSRNTISRKQFMENAEAVSFCLTYFQKRHGEQVMPPERFAHILENAFFEHVVVYTNKDNVPVAYVFEVTDKHITHFWFSFYTLELVYQSLGMWLMQDSARIAQANGKTYFYIGTVYGEKALYKANFPNIEWWDGSQWIADVKCLKQKARADAENTVNTRDEWKKEVTFF